MKDVYEKPAVNIMMFECGDVIITSGDGQIDTGTNGTEGMPMS